MSDTTKLCNQCNTKPIGLNNKNAWNFQGLCQSCWSVKYRVNKIDKVVNDMFNIETNKELN